MREDMISMDINSLPITNNGITYKMMVMENLQDAVDCLAETFIDSEPITRALGITAADFKVFANFFCQSAVKEELSVIACDQKTGKLVGCLISEDLVTRLPQDLEDNFPKFAPIISLMRKMDKDYIHTNHIDKNEVMHEFLLGVYPRWQGYHIGENLVRCSMIQGKIMNYKGAVAEIGNPVTRHIHEETSGFYVVGNMKFKDFVYDHSRVFKDLITDDNKSCKLVYKSI